MVDLFQLFGTSELSKEGGNPHENETRVMANTPKTDRLQSFDPFRRCQRSAECNWI